MFYKRVGKRLRAKRLAFGHTQTQCGKKIGVSYQMVQKYETGKARIPLDKLYKLSNLYNFTLDWAVSGKSPYKGDFNTGLAIGLSV